ncbi:TIGR04282 family arsenosugar biosynthesis glycosyltransferase [Algisphaera agarilytica]|uniref:RSAM/selenodomain-associated transferase 1 n=1 Tax=Algisphaera agarilytica TaxID=1385975 RepID=A0A7X0LKJ2_9BACT|nr:TIGR04282 family arsenosugar biosynthesis glycosyltransferase [Algisphaera agarilytica]MBB6430485.1 rSAM/selenodomain-associated transferase 1 [Algisphaera agarilytica]
MEKTVTNNNVTFSVVVMAKAAVPGRVKTRLTRGEHALSEVQASDVHSAMLDTVLARVSAHLRAPDGSQPRLILAMDDPAGAPQAAKSLGWHVVSQGEGDLGERLDRVWQGSREQTGHDGVVFFGVDSPDVPTNILESIGDALNHAAAVIGPVEDGGYWTLACRDYLPGLLTGIDWGTPAVYDQTLAIARDAGIDLQPLPGWHDVDDPADLAALVERLASTAEPHLTPLRDRLTPLAPDSSPTMSDTPTPTSSAPLPTGADQDEPMDLSDSTLLLVDDNEQNVELLQAYLEALPCRTLTAFDGEEAMSIIEDDSQPTPDLVLLDVMMPRMSGFEVCQKIKENPKTRTIPVMMVTALNELGDIERGVEAGTDDFLTKPVNKLELITRVKSLLRVRHLKRELDRTEAYIDDLERNRRSTDSDAG